MNSCCMVGRLTRDPELRYTRDGKPVCGFAIAVDNPFKKDRDGNRQADFFNVTVWGQRAETISQHLVKGQRVGLQGRIEVRQYETQDGRKGTSVDIVASDVEFLDKPRGQGDGDDGYQRGREQYQRQPPQQQYESRGQGAYQPATDDDIPF